jgi:hypothetical protein
MITGYARTPHHRERVTQLERAAQPPTPSLRKAPRTNLQTSPRRRSFTFHRPQGAEPRHSRSPSSASAHATPGSDQRPPAKSRYKQTTGLHRRSSPDRRVPISTRPLLTVEGSCHCAGNVNRALGKGNDGVDVACCETSPWPRLRRQLREHNLARSRVCADDVDGTRHED